MVWDFEISDFGFVSDFGFRISDFLAECLPKSCLTVQVFRLYWKRAGPRPALSRTHLAALGSPAMKRIVACLLTLTLMGGVARAQEPIDSELDFVRKQRAKGYTEFAKAYLERMEK